MALSSKSIILSLLSILISTYQLAQTLSAEQVKEDLTFMSEKIIEINAGLIDYNEHFIGRKDSLIANSNKSMSLLEFYGPMSFLGSMSNEGHLKIGHTRDTVQNGFLNDRYDYLPISCWFSGDRAFVRQYYGREKGPGKGDEILSINGRKTSDVINQILPYLPSDGQINTYKMKKMVSGFSWYYYLFVDQPDSFTIEFSRYDSGDKYQTSISAIPRSDMVEIFTKLNTDQKKKAEPNINDFYELEIEQDVARLTLKSFDWRLVEKYKLKPSDFYKEVFAKLVGVKNLIVDLRSNTGGRKKFASAILPYLSDPGNGYFKKTVTTKGKKKEYKYPKSSKLKFEGKVFVLVNGETFSAAATLARYLKEYANAVCIGEEGGGRYEGYVAGSSETVYLPNSKLKIQIPIYNNLYPPSSKQQTTNRGLIPDHEITYSISDFMNERDRSLQKAHELINGL